jgi:hypothetical protein
MLEIMGKMKCPFQLCFETLCYTAAASQKHLWVQVKLKVEEMKISPLQVQFTFLKLSIRNLMFLSYA